MVMSWQERQEELKKEEEKQKRLEHQEALDEEEYELLDRGLWTTSGNKRVLLKSMTMPELKEGLAMVSQKQSAIMNEWAGLFYAEIQERCSCGSEKEKKDSFREEL